MKTIDDLVKKYGLKSFDSKWIPQAGDFYAWSPHTVRQGRIQIAIVESYDIQGRIVHGRQLSSMRERRSIYDVLYLPDMVAIDVLNYFDKLRKRREGRL